MSNKSLFYEFIKLFYPLNKLKLRFFIKPKKMSNCTAVKE